MCIFFCCSIHIVHTWSLHPLLGTATAATIVVQAKAYARRSIRASATAKHCGLVCDSRKPVQAVDVCHLRVAARRPALAWPDCQEQARCVAKKENQKRKKKKKKKEKKRKRRIINNKWRNTISEKVQQLLISMFQTGFQLGEDGKNFFATLDKLVQHYKMMPYDTTEAGPQYLHVVSV